jgi:hypothetical protein
MSNQNNQKCIDSAFAATKDYCRTRMLAGNQSHCLDGATTAQIVLSNGTDWCTAGMNNCKLPNQFFDSGCLQLLYNYSDCAGDYRPCDLTDSSRS